MISRTRYRSVVDAVHGLAGADVRVVGVVSESGRGLHDDLLYLRDDVAAAYSPEELDAIQTEMLFELWNHDFQGDLFDAGEMEYALRRYDDAIVVMCHHGDFAVVVSVDADTDVEVRSIVDVVCDGLEDGGRD